MNLSEYSDAELEAALAASQPPVGMPGGNAPDWQNQSVLERTIGRSARSVAGGTGAILDAPRILTDPLFGLLEMGADAVGADSVRDYAKSERTAPYFSDRFKGGYDAMTGGDYQPVGAIEKGVDFTTELGYSFLSPAALQRLGTAGIEGLQKLGGYFNSGGKDIPKEYQKIVEVLRSEGKTDAEIMKIAKESQQSKVPTTVFEAAESPKGTALQRSLTEEPSVAGSKMQEFNKARLDDVIPQALMDDAAKGAETTSSYTAGQRSQEVASSLIDDAIKARTSATSPQYKKAAQDILPDELVQKFMQDPVYKGVLEALEREPAFQRLTQGMNKNSAGYWDYVYRPIRDKSGVLKRSGDMTLSGSYGAAADDLKTALDAASPTLKTGRAEFADLSPEVMNLQRGLVGQIAKAKSPEKIGDLIIRESPEVISRTKRAFLAKDPQAWQDITSAYMTARIEKATSLRTFLSQVDKNQITRRKMRALLTPAQYKGHRLLVENLRRIEAGLPRNSETVSKAQAAAELAGGNLDEQVITRLVNNPNMRSQAADAMLAAYRAGKGKINSEFKAKLADALVSPDLEKLGVALRGKKTGSPEAVQAVDKFLLPYLGAAAETQSLGSASSQQRMIPDAAAEKPVNDINLESFSDEELQKALEGYDQQSSNQTVDPADFIKQHEGFRAQAYDDGTGKMTIGYGTTRFRGNEITQEQAEKLLRRDMAKAEKVIDSVVKVDLTPNQKTALISLAYNIGTGAFRNSTLLKKLNKGDYAAAAAQFDRWNKAKVKGRMQEVAGLTKRRESEKQLFSS